MRRPPAHLLSLSLLALSLTAAPQAEEVPASGPEGAFVDTVDVNVVNVDVHVTDKNGRRILGLTRDDFEVFENGQPVEITNFYLAEGRRARRDGAVGPLPEKADPNRVGELMPPALPEDQRLHLVIYVDNVNIHPLNRDKGLTAVRSFLLRRLGPDDRVMVVSYDRGLKERQAFTVNHQLIYDALFEFEKDAGHRVQYNRERSELLNDIYDARSPSEVSGRARLWADRAYDDLERSLGALREVVDSLAGLPGRKALLYVSDGLGMRAGEDIFYALNDRFNDSMDLLQVHNYDASRRFREIARAASSNRITFYTLDAAGLRTHANADVANYHAGRGTIVESTHVANLQEPLQYLAVETGGQAIVNTNNFLPLLDRIGDDFETYYSLGYVAAGLGSGQFREIEARVKDRKDLVVRHREGYRDKSVAIRMSEGTLAALNYGWEKNDLGVEIQFGRAVPQDNEAYHVPMVIKIPMGNLVFVPRQAVHLASVRLFIAARDEAGRMAPIQEVAVPIEIPDDKLTLARQHAYQLQHALLLRPGGQLIAVGVRDEIGAATSFVLGGLRLEGGAAVAGP